MTTTDRLFRYAHQAEGRMPDPATKEALRYGSALAAGLFSQPYVRIANIVADNLAKRQTASVYLQQLGKIGILHEIKVGREKLFVHPALIRLLTTEENDTIRLISSQ